MAYLWISEDNLGEGVGSVSTTWVPRIELRLSGLVTDAFIL